MYDGAMSEIVDGSTYKAQIDKIYKARGFRSYADLAEKAGLNRSTLSRLFDGRGKRSGNASTLAALAKALDTTVEFISGETDDARKNDDIPLPEYAFEIIETMRHLERSQRHELWVIAEAFRRAALDITRIRREEVTREYLSEIKDTIMRIADETGRGIELDQYLQKQLDHLNNRPESAQSTSQDGDGDGDLDSEQTDKPPGQ